MIGNIDPARFNYRTTYETKHLWLVDDDNTVQELDLLFAKGQNGTWCGKMGRWKVIGTDLFDNQRSAKKESLRRIGPKFAEGAWVEQTVERWDGSKEKKQFQVDRSRQGLVTGRWFYHEAGDPTDDFNGPEEHLTPIEAPAFAEGEWLVWQGHVEGTVPYAPGMVTARQYRYGRWEYTTNKLMGFYPARSFKQVKKPLFAVGDYASCCGGPGAEITERVYGHDVRGWRYTLAGGGAGRHVDFCLRPAEKPAPKAEKPSLPLTPRFQVGQRVQWERSWDAEPNHGVVTSIVLDEDGDLRYGVTQDGEDMTDETDRHDFYDKASGETDQDLQPEKEETAVAPFWSGGLV